MEKIISFVAILACATAAPLLLTHDDLYHIPLARTNTLIHTLPVVHAPVVHAIPVVHAAPIVHTAKTTVTKSSQVVNHGGTALLHSVPVVHDYEHQYHEVYVPQKSTITKSNQIVNHGSSYHASVIPVHTPVFVHSSPVVAVKTGDSAVSHHSSTVHETVPVVKSVSLVSYH